MIGLSFNVGTQISRKKRKTTQNRASCSFCHAFMRKFPSQSDGKLIPLLERPHILDKISQQF